MSNVKIRYSTIIEDCKMMSAYDGRMASGGGGESLYPEIRITTKDEPEIGKFIKDAVLTTLPRIQSTLEDEVEFGSNSTDGDYFQIVTSADLDRSGGNSVNKGFVQHLTESVICYVMHRWYEDKLPSRSENYKQMYVDMLAVLVKTAFARIKPTLNL